MSHNDLFRDKNTRYGDRLTASQLRDVTCLEFGGSDMVARTSMLHVRADDQLKAEATEKLAFFGLTVSD